MAIVTQGFEITVTVADAGGQRSTLTYICDPVTVTDFATAQTAEIAIRTDLQNVSDSVVVGSSIKEIRYNDAIVLPVGAQNENKASVTAQLLGVNKKTNFKIPAPKDVLFVSPTTGEANNIVDVEAPLLVQYAGNWLAAGYFTISDGQKLSTDPNGSGLLVGKRIHAKNNNG